MNDDEFWREWHQWETGRLVMAFFGGYNAVDHNNFLVMARWN